LAALFGRPPVSFTDRALERLSNYLWFGNVPELEAVLARSVALCRESSLDVDDCIRLLTRPGELDMKVGSSDRVDTIFRMGLAGELAYRQGYFSDKEFAKFTAADKERQLEEALMLDNPVTEISIAMEVNYFQLNSAEYFVPVAVKIPGSELALARRRGAPRAPIRRPVGSPSRPIIERRRGQG
jgi:DNA-binding NtrC family response regulator